jgi:hypothetical protein
LGIIPPEFTILGIPVQSSNATATFDFPTGVASSAKVLASGLGAGSHTFPDTEGLGIFMTTVFNLICPPFMIAAGAAQNLDPFIKLGIIPLVQTSIEEFFTLLDDLNGDVGYQDLLNLFVRGVARSGAGIMLKIVGILAENIFAAVLEDAVPIAGQIIQAIGAAGAGLEFLETAFEVAHSPWTYEYDLQLTHDLSLTIKPNPQQDNTTPKAATQALVTALFDSGGTPRTTTIALPQPLPELAVTFSDVPLGGQVNVSASFYQVPADPSQDHVLLGKATTGLVSNAVDMLDSVTIAELQFPLGPNTVYVHKQKSTLNAQGTHLWTVAAAPVTKQSDISCEGVGNLCEFRGITVRQGTGQTPGYVGYAWRGDSASVSECGCTVNCQGQLDQLANLNTGATAQTGYAFLPCGLPRGVQVAYSLLSNGTANFYLDSTSNIIRQVQLDPTPVFDDPTQQRAWGKLNFDSDALLLHPTGQLISISNAAHKFESLRPPAAPMSDTDAAVSLLAQLHSSQGSRPGLLDAPSAAAISPEGVILVLEQGNNRLQAFDTGGNPVQFFSQQPAPYFLTLDATSDPNTQYLDLAVEFTGFLYVLSYNQTTNEYRMDLYHPGQSGTQPIATTPNVNAARLTVDFWRNVYTLNYEVLRLPNGMVPSITEPSVSLWTPTGASS